MLTDIASEISSFVDTDLLAACVSVGALSQGQKLTYWTVQHILAVVTRLFYVTLQGARVQWFEEFKTAEKLARHGHYRTPIVKLATVLGKVSILHRLNQ